MNHYCLARAVASKSFVTYCREGCVGEKFSGCEVWEQKEIDSIATP